ncbi:glutamate receptor ionotropic, kainate 1 [Caerostris extrusa]|uniref:Glutamate receptor ionotropic, kainate 1 n=1 Tax=Caerostris extrusa TaxID=172846 RepID=A0AAV4QGC7_CAEEX|nr:glutamate receptor ionotropic, kainate 1 [Caerostris extrusa]
MRFTGSIYVNKRVSEDSFGVWNVGVVLSKKFCCEDQLNKIILSLISAGMYEKIINDEIFRSGLGTYVDIINSEKTHSLNLEDMYGVFILLIAGYLISAICFIGEIIFYRKIQF